MTFTAYLKDGTQLIIPNNQNRTMLEVQQQLVELYEHNFDRIEEAAL